jgi:hypothetical protein
MGATYPQHSVIPQLSTLNLELVSCGANLERAQRATNKKNNFLPVTKRYNALPGVKLAAFLPFHSPTLNFKHGTLNLGAARAHLLRYASRNVRLTIADLDVKEHQEGGGPYTTFPIGLGNYLLHRATIGATHGLDCGT